MIEVHPDRWMDLYSLFAETRFGVLGAGTLQGGHPGRVFTDNTQHPRVGLISTRVGYYFLAGDPTFYPPVIGEIVQLVDCELMPQQIAQIGDPQFLLFYEPDGWKDQLVEAFAPHKPIQIQKKRMLLPGLLQKDWSGWRNQIPGGMQLLPVTLELLEQHPQEADVLQLFWGSLENFLQKSAGFWLVDGDTIVSTCEAVFIGAGEAEISIATSLEYRRQGLARLTACAMIEACLNRGLKPIWGCWPENLPSVNLAHSLGFIDDCDQAVMLVEYPLPKES